MSRLEVVERARETFDSIVDLTDLLVHLLLESLVSIIHLFLESFHSVKSLLESCGVAFSDSSLEFSLLCNESDVELGDLFVSFCQTSAESVQLLVCCSEVRSDFLNLHCVFVSHSGSSVGSSLCFLDGSTQFCVLLSERSVVSIDSSLQCFLSFLKSRLGSVVLVSLVDLCLEVGNRSLDSLLLLINNAFKCLELVLQTLDVVIIVFTRDHCACCGDCKGAQQECT